MTDNEEFNRVRARAIANEKRPQPKPRKDTPAELKAAIGMRLHQAKMFGGYGKFPRIGWGELVRGNQRVVCSIRDAGLRFTAWAGKRHACSDMAGDNFRGAVLAISGRDGSPRYLAAYDTAWRDGTFFVECSRIFRDLTEAKKAANDFAKIEAAREHFRGGLISDDPASYPI